MIGNQKTESIHNSCKNCSREEERYDNAGLQDYRMADDVWRDWWIQFRRSHQIQKQMYVFLVVITVYIVPEGLHPKGHGVSRNRDGYPTPNVPAKYKGVADDFDDWQADKMQINYNTCSYLYKR